MKNNIISVYMKEGGTMASYYEAEKISLFDRQRGVWQEISSFPVRLGHSADVQELLRETGRIIDRLGDCRIIAGKKLLGVPYAEFDRHGFFIFEISSFGPRVFNGILEDIEADREEADTKEKIIREARPVETSVAGVYYLDLVELQTDCPEVSSKQAMKEFFEKTPFIELHLICRHIPPWLENMGLDIQTQKTGDGNFKAKISKKQCGGVS